eukprot:g19390.t1
MGSSTSVLHDADYDFAESSSSSNPQDGGGEFSAQDDDFDSTIREEQGGAGAAPEAGSKRQSEEEQECVTDLLSIHDQILGVGTEIFIPRVTIAGLADLVHVAKLGRLWNPMLSRQDGSHELVVRSKRERAHDMLMFEVKAGETSRFGFTSPTATTKTTKSHEKMKSHGRARPALRADDEEIFENEMTPPPSMDFLFDEAVVVSEVVVADFCAVNLQFVEIRVGSSSATPIPLLGGKHGGNAASSVPLPYQHGAMPPLEEDVEFRERSPKTLLPHMVNKGDHAHAGEVDTFWSPPPGKKISIDTAEVALWHLRHSIRTRLASRSLVSSSCILSVVLHQDPMGSNRSKQEENKTTKLRNSTCCPLSLCPLLAGCFATLRRYCGEKSGVCLTE